MIYKYALDHIPKAEAQELYKRFIAFEKQSGSREAIEDVIVSKRRFQYQEVRACAHSHLTPFCSVRSHRSAAVSGRTGHAVR